MSIFNVNLYISKIRHLLFIHALYIGFFQTFEDSNKIMKSVKSKNLKTN